jgi:hypothetical protein
MNEWTDHFWRHAHDMVNWSWSCFTPRPFLTINIYIYSYYEPKWILLEMTTVICTKHRSKYTFNKHKFVTFVIFVHQMISVFLIFFTLLIKISVNVSSNCNYRLYIFFTGKKWTLNNIAEHQPREILIYKKNSSKSCATDVTIWKFANCTPVLVVITKIRVQNGEF